MTVLWVAVAQSVAFYILAVAMVVAAIGVVRSQNVVHAALYLVVVLAGAAGQFILVAAEFVAWVQVLIYIGAVVILFLFGIMLTRAPMRSEGSLDNEQKWAAAVVGLFLFGVITALLVDAYGGKQIKLQRQARRDRQRRERRARRSSATTSCPFEVVSMLLLAALIGAVVIAWRD